MKPYYDCGGIQIYHGDCREVLPTLHETVLFADPPYGVDKAEWDKEFLLDWMNFGSFASECMAVTPGIANLLSMPRAVLRQTYRWTLSVRVINNTIVRGAIGFGNWIPCLIYSAEDMSIYQCAQDATEIAIRGAMPEHPSPKPIDAMMWILSRLPEGAVIDPFMGSGTTLRAAKDLGRKAIGIEIEEKYCEIAARRMEQDVIDFGDQSQETKSVQPKIFEE